MGRSSDRKRVGKENDVNGTSYQVYVGHYLEKKTGETAIVTKKHGIDVICGELQIEVKGWKNIFYHRKGSGKTKKGRIRNKYQIRGWKVDPTACPETITHIAFILIEKNICNAPLIYIVSIDDIKKQFVDYPDVQWVPFKLAWVWEHYIPELSYIPIGELFY